MLKYVYLNRWIRALKNLAAKVMEQVGLLGQDIPVDGLFLKIKAFTREFLNVNSAGQDIGDYKAQLIVVIDELQVSVSPCF